MHARSALACLAGALLLSTTAGATMAVVPPQNENTEGNSANSFPFNAPAIRYQQIYDGSALSGHGGIVEQIAFRVDGSGTGFTTTMFDVEIRLSHAATAPDSMSLTFADNVGADETVVFSGMLGLSGTGGSQPNPFDVVIDIDDVFAYDGSSHLLLDMKIFSGSPINLLDSVSTSLGALLVQRVWSLDINATSGTSVGDRGLVTLFQLPDPPFIPVDIDIKPKSDRNSVKPNSGAPIPVAILGSDDFDVADVDVTTLAFGPAGAAAKTKPTPRMGDQDGDGLDDLLVRFRTPDTGIAVGDTIACLTGELLDGTPFEGCDAVRTVR